MRRQLTFQLSGSLYGSEKSCLPSLTVRMTTVLAPKESEHMLVHGRKKKGLLRVLVRRLTTSVCCMPEEHIANIERRQRHDSGARLICYLDGMSEQLVHRQLEFRKEHRMKRSPTST